MSTFTIRLAIADDRAGIHAVEEQAFGQKLEADLVDRLVADGDAVLELVAERDGELIGHVLFSRLTVRGQAGDFAAVALAPLAVAPAAQRAGIGGALVRAAHERLAAAGESLSVVLGDPAYYGRFGYERRRAEGFDSDYQGEALQALAWSEAPTSGRLIYAAAFADL